MRYILRAFVLIPSIDFWTAAQSYSHPLKAICKQQDDFASLFLYTEIVREREIEPVCMYVCSSVACRLHFRKPKSDFIFQEDYANHQCVLGYAWEKCQISIMYGYPAVQSILTPLTDLALSFVLVRLCTTTSGF